MITCGVRVLFAAATLVAVGFTPVTSSAADLGVDRMVPVYGVPCESPEVQAFQSVWLGHFDGGYSHYLGPGTSVALDWRDEKLCFPSARTCNAYVSGMRRSFHRPEGYFTCLPIR